MTRRLAAPLIALLALCAAPAPASAQQFGISGFDVAFTDESGATVTQAGAHPYEMTTSFAVDTKPAVGGEGVNTAEPFRDLEIAQIAGFVGNPTAVPTCSSSDFLTPTVNGDGLNVPNCPDSAAVGLVSVESITIGTVNAPVWSAVYNLATPPGVAAKLGFWTVNVPVTIELGVNETPPYNVLGGPTNISQVVEVTGSEFVLWGVPADPSHDSLRGGCLFSDDGEPGSLGKCPAGVPEEPFLTLPRACEGPLETSYKARSWQGALATGSVLTHDAAGLPQGMTGCAKLGFTPRIGADATTEAAASPTGLEFSLDVDNPGLANPGGFADADIDKTVVTLPEGMTLNPSQAEGLGVCSEDQLARETPTSGAGEGCPGDSKVGTIEVQTPLLAGETLHGSLYVAKPYHNLAGDALIAVYVVIRHPARGVIFRQPLRVEPDPETGQLISTAEDMPHWPFSELRLRFRGGERAPLISPPGCGDFEVEALLHPSTGASAVTSSDSFELTAGPGGAPCPAGAAPFDPGFAAGTLNNAAAAHSPFAMRITRGDGMQDLSKFSAVLPPGVVGKIAGIPWCGEPGIARAKARTGTHGAQEELDDPSCPAASQVGRTTAGAGVGSQLTYVGGSLYLAGPYKGAPLSVVAITPAKAGPFDAGVVVVRVGLKLNPITARVEADGAASDPIPHILKGIPLNVRDLRIYTDRPDFTLNATSCEEEQTHATLWGAGTALAPAPETPVGLAARYQAAGCASLGFAPKLGVKLKGGTKRGKFPALRAHYRPRGADANLKRLALTFPTSAFIEQGHFRTICTRVQFAAGPGHGALCPPASRYGTARVWSPLLDGPLRGPVYLRSSDNNLPDAVLTLRGPPSAPFAIEVVVRIDSVNGRLRATVDSAPDAPVSRAIVDMQGGQKGLFVNSRNLCHKPNRNRIRANLRGQNGARSQTNPRAVAVRCAKRRGARRARAKRAKRAAGHVSRASALG